MNKRTAERSTSAGTQRRLIAATREAIRDGGIESATAREITGRAGVNLSAIPYHFGTKDALVIEALLADAHEILDPILDLLGSDLPPQERALRAAEILNDQFEAQRARIPAVVAAVARAPHDPEVALALGEIFSDVRNRLAEDVQGLVDAGHAPSWVVPNSMAGLLVAVVSGVLVASLVDPTGPSPAEVGAQFVSLLVAVATQGGTPS